MRALYELQVELARWQAILNSARDAIISIDPSGRVTLFNPSAEAIFGYSAGEVIGRNVSMLMPSPYQEQHDGYLAAYRQTQVPKAIGRVRYVEARRKNGEIFPIELSVSEAHVGDEVLYTAILRDVTERKEIEEARARLAAIVDSTNVAIIGKALDGRITAWNSGAERLYGYSADEMIGEPVAVMIPAEHRADLAERLERVRRGDHVKQYSTLRLRKDGTPIEVLLDLSPIRGREAEIVGISSISYDLSELRRAEQRLAAQYAITRSLASAGSLAEAAPAILATVGAVAGWRAGELWYADFDSELLRCAGFWAAERDRDGSLARITRDATFAAGEGLPGRVWQSGKPLWIGEEASALGLRSRFAFPIPGGGRTTGVLLFFGARAAGPDALALDLLQTVSHQIGDFIERQRAEERVRENEARFHAFMNNSPSVAFLKDESGRFVYVNAAFERILRRPLASVRGHTDFEVWGPELASRMRSHDLAVLAEGRPAEATEVVPTPDGGDREWLMVKFPIEEAGGRRLLGGIAVDVTERRRSEERLRELERLAQRRERLADIGAVTAKIAHDLGNPLTGISLQARLILGRARKDPEQPLSSIVRTVEQLQSEIARLEGMVRGFLGFARDQRLDLCETDLPGLLEEVYRLWQPVAAARNIELKLEAAPSVPTTRVDAGQLRRVFDNLLKNAVEAIDGDAGAVNIVLVQPDRSRVRISVADTGPGVAAGVELFSLFETTKPDGSGLGLALSRQIVHAHGGEIVFERLSPRGAVFHVDLPLSTPPTAHR